MKNKKPELEPVTDKKVVDRYLKYSVDLHEPFACFVEGSEIHFDAVAKAHLASSNELDIEIDIEDFRKLSYDTLELLVLPHTELRASFSVGDVLYFLHAHVGKRTGRTLRLKIDLPLFKLQRRETLRIKVKGEHQALLMVQEYTYVPLDISAGGMSVVIPLSREAFFRENKLLRACTLRFGGIEIKVDMEVTGLSRPKKGNENEWKVGFRFLGLPAAAEQAIARQAYLHSHKIWSRWI